MYSVCTVLVCPKHTNSHDQWKLVEICSSWSRLRSCSGCGGRSGCHPDPSLPRASPASPAAEQRVRRSLTELHRKRKIQFGDNDSNSPVGCWLVTWSCHTGSSVSSEQPFEKSADRCWASNLVCCTSLPEDTKQLTPRGLCRMRHGKVPWSKWENEQQFTPSLLRFSCISFMSVSARPCTERPWM